MPNPNCEAEQAVVDAAVNAFNQVKSDLDAALAASPVNQELVNDLWQLLAEKCDDLSDAIGEHQGCLAALENDPPE